MSQALQLLIDARNPLISIQTNDEERAVVLVRGTAIDMKRPLFEWSMTSGLCPVNVNRLGDPIVPPDKVSPALRHMLTAETGSIFLLKDLGPHCKDALVNRTLRDLVCQLPARNAAMILVDALPLPDEIRRFTVHFPLAWPTAEELEVTVRDTYKFIQNDKYKKIDTKITKRDMERLIGTLRGLTCSEAERVFAAAIHDDYALTAEDLPRIVEGKRTLLGSAGCLEAIAADVTPDNVGGLDNLKQWLSKRRGAFTQKARDFGLESPRGVLMLGVPGCGKSLSAKVIARDWGMPLMRLDPGVLYQKYIGESESQLRQALAQAEAMSPVVLWIDEIEKAFASADAATADGGLSKRMFGTLLTWMQDHRHEIFLIATANDISALPPELMRKGRFDEVFFIDLPKAPARQRILEIHLAKRKRDPKRFQVATLAELTEGFSGSELEQAVISALFAAYSENTDLTDQHLVNEIRQTRPLSSLMAERVRDLRAWAADRCVSAD